MQVEQHVETMWADVEPTPDRVAWYIAGNTSNPYNAAKAAIFERLLPADMHGLRVLDYGGGAGWMAVRCAERGADATLVDASPRALALAKALAQSRGVAGRVQFVNAARLSARLRDGRFDIVLAKDIIEHIDEDAAFLADLAASQPRGGLMLLSTHNRTSLNYLLEGTYERWWCGNKGWCGWDPTHVRFYTSRVLRRLLRDAGYRARRYWGMYIIPYNILTWATLLRKNVSLPGLRRFDVSCGGIFPLNRIGWNIVIRAERA
jgi:2-polyprenyl-6-hydroxyphenyl methylase/3-demethylubiquinone-9 3-methyltransferase